MLGKDLSQEENLKNGINCGRPVHWCKCYDQTGKTGVQVLHLWSCEGDILPDLRTGEHI